MLTISAESVHDFRVCSFYYREKYIEKERDPSYAREQLAERFENTLKRVVSFFFYKRQGGIVPSYNALVNRWEKLWFPKEVTAYDIATESHESAHKNLVSYSNIAIAALLGFHNEFEKTDAEPVIISEKFLVPLGKEVRLEGAFDLILRYKNEYQIVRLSTKTKRPPLESFQFDFVAQRIAFEYNHRYPAIASYSIYDLGSTHPGRVFIDPDDEQVDTFLYWVNQVYNTKLHIPRRGFTVYCRNCPFDKPCAAFKYPPTNYAG